MHKSGLMELEAVVAIARLGSFRAAAIDLDVSPTAIGNAVSSLENRLGVRLFNRTTRNVALTSAGREYVDAIARTFRPQAARHDRPVPTKMATAPTVPAAAAAAKAIAKNS